MSADLELDFVNRNDELTFLLRGLLRKDVLEPALVVVRSPTGFGKSRLTEQLSVRCQTEIPKLQFCIVEPEIQVHAEAVRLHEGFFIQRCAEQLSRFAESKAVSWVSFAEFLSSRRWKTLKHKKKEDWISEMPGFKSAYKIALDYAHRALSLGSYAPDRLLRGDSREAVAICTEYLEGILSCFRIALVVREVQHCDLQSLRTLLEWNQAFPDLDMILEYTSNNSQFDAAHSKLLTRIAGRKRNFRILDLMRLGEGHLEHIIRSSVDSAFSMTTDAYLSWNGNLHSVLEMQFRVGIGRNIVSPLQIEQALGDLPFTLSVHIDGLSSLHRIVLAICLAHVESVQEEVLQQALHSIVPMVSALQARKILRDLVEVHRFLDQSEGTYRIHIEIVADTLRQLVSFRSVLAAAEKALRDLYCKQVFDANWAVSGMAISVRQVFRLCAQTKDATGLLRATSALSTEIARAQDQSLYAEVIASAVAASPRLYGEDHDRLLLWAASLAYDVSSFEIVEELLVAVESPDEICNLMRACALQERGRHDQALQIVTQLRSDSASSEVRLVTDLIEAMIRGCRGDFVGTREMLECIIAEPAHAHSPMLGYAYRFFEVIEDNDSCIEQIHRSIAWFERFGMESSRAYSQAAAAVLLARIGDISAARSMISAASDILSEKVRDRHLLLNNIAAIELLSAQPDFSRCVDVLAEALRYVRDDYSEVTVLSNLALAHSGAGNGNAAAECVDATLLILEDHDFASRYVYWPVCFNAAYVLKALGQTERAAQVLLWPENRAPAPVQNKSYWDYRYRRSMELDESWRYLGELPFHPLYLSHWLIDLDGLNRMRSEPPK